MKLIYEKETIESILNALNSLTGSGIANAKILAYVADMLCKNEVLSSAAEND